MAVTLAASCRVVVATLSSAGPLPNIPDGVQAADVRNTGGDWYIYNKGSSTNGYLVFQNEEKHLPGSFLRDIWVSPGTYRILYYF